MKNKTTPTRNHALKYMAMASLCIGGGLVWKNYDNIRPLIGQRIMYVALAGIVCLVMLLTQQSAPSGGFTDDDEDDGFGFELLTVNPKTGAPMLDDIGGFDTMGYTFGSGPDDDL